MNQPILGDYTFTLHKKTKQPLPGGLIEEWFAIFLKAKGEVIASMYPISEAGLPEAEATAKVFCNSVNLLNVSRKVIEEIEPCQSLNGSQRDAIQKLHKAILASTL